MISGAKFRSCLRHCELKCSVKLFFLPSFLSLIFFLFLFSLSFSFSCSLSFFLLFVSLSLFLQDFSFFILKSNLYKESGIVSISQFTPKWLQQSDMENQESGTLLGLLHRWQGPKYLNHLHYFCAQLNQKQNTTLHCVLHLHFKTIKQLMFFTVVFCVLTHISVRDAIIRHLNWSTVYYKSNLTLDGSQCVQMEGSRITHHVKQLLAVSNIRIPTSLLVVQLHSKQCTSESRR